MSQISETALFEACIAKPRTNFKVANLNLNKVKEPKNVNNVSKDKIQIQKATRLFHMAWSGITKYLKTVCIARGKPVELTDIGILVPMNEVNKNTMKLTTATLNQLK